MSYLELVTNNHSVPATPHAALTIFGDALHARDHGTHAHSHRVVCYALRLGRVLGLGQADLVTLERGVYLHDIGKIFVPDAILNKPGPLTDAEWKVMRRHPSIGYAMLAGLPFLVDAAEIVLAHHERFDGTGYPKKLRGEQIPFGARIFSIVDALDALTCTDRPYRTPATFAEASAHIRTQAGTHFDPTVVDAFLAVPTREWEELRGSLSVSLPSPN
ncbi:MAG TPA: HD-GYP domain-containing protein [Nitrospirales bacterium]|nr:HD-GYP domain-containing protein [Nitrospirales bacterium]